MRSSFRFAVATTTICLSALLTACAYPPGGHPGYGAPNYQGSGYVSYPDQRGVEFGTVTYVEGVHEHNRTSGLGAVLGAVVGGVIGNQIGGGTGRAAATALGAVGGAVAGDAIEGRNNNPEYEAYRVTVQLDRGGQRVYQVPTHGELRPGDRVRMYEGQISRL